MISIINYGLGNLGSIYNMFKYLGIDSKIVDNPLDLNNIEKILLPGVGAFDAGMRCLQDSGWEEALSELVLIKKTPILGICLGMQLMTESSEEGNSKGLGWIKGNTKKFNFAPITKLKVPHMGWRDVRITRHTSLFPESWEENRFYFVHSYHVDLEQQNDQILESEYGINFTAGFNNENIYGLQFHPEKSHAFGKRVFERFNKL